MSSEERAREGTGAPYCLLRLIESGNVDRQPLKTAIGLPFFQALCSTLSGQFQCLPLHPLLGHSSALCFGSEAAFGASSKYLSFICVASQQQACISNQALVSPR